MSFRSPYIISQIEAQDNQEKIKDHREKVKFNQLIDNMSYHAFDCKIFNYYILISFYIYFEVVKMFSFKNSI